MHRVTYTIRSIAPSELPMIAPLGEKSRAMNDAELLNAGIAHLHDDLYSCVDQYRRDRDTMVWSVEGPQSPGTVITEGSLRQRHAQLPADVAPKVFRAQVIRASDPATSAVSVAQANLAEVAAALTEYVGDVAGAPLVDLTGSAALLTEAQRLVQIPDNGIDRHVVPMILVTPGDITESSGIIPHQWHGESRH